MILRWVRIDSAQKKVSSQWYSWFFQIHNLITFRRFYLISSIDTFVNRLTTSRLTIWLEWITTSTQSASASRYLDRIIEDGTRKLITLCLSYVKGLAERIPKYVVHLTSGQYSREAQLSGSISSVSSHKQNSTWSITVCTLSLVVVQ